MIRVVNGELAAAGINYEKEQALLARWMTRLTRAFHSVEKLRKKIARLERELAKLTRS